jgi:hypothetical protein
MAAFLVVFCGKYEIRLSSPSCIINFGICLHLVAFIVILMWEGQDVTSRLVFDVLILSGIVAYSETNTVLNDNLVLPVYATITIIFLTYSTWMNIFLVV